jgi:hypothetical protein
MLKISILCIKRIKKGKKTCKIQKNVVTLQPKCKYKQN